MPGPPAIRIPRIWKMRLLVDPGQGERRTTHPHLLGGHLQGVGDRGESGGTVLGLADLQAVLGGVVLGCASGHLATLSPRTPFVEPVVAP